MEEEKYWDLMSKYLADDISIREMEELLLWFEQEPGRADLLKELQDTWDKSKNYSENLRVDTATAWSKVNRTISGSYVFHRTQPTRRYKFVTIVLPVLFAFAACFVGYNYFTSSRVIEVATLEGEKRQVILPAGPKVWLNEAGSISYRSDNGFEVKLRGEAFFDVRSEEKMFIVKAGETIVEVNAGSFNVLDDQSGNVTVRVVSGNLHLKSRKRPEQALFLQAGEKGVMRKEGYAEKEKYKSRNFLFWKTGELVFAETPFSQVVQTLENSYPVKFHIEDMGILNRAFTGSFKEASFDLVIESLERALDLRIEKKGGIYFVKKSP